jgi:HSP20 family protein
MRHPFDQEVLTMLRFDPFRDLDRLTEQLLGVSAGTPAGTPRAPRFMPMDLYRKDDAYVLTADLPGVDPESLDVAVDNGVLTVKAERPAPTVDGAQWIAGERFTGTYLRQLSVGDGIDVDRISADYDNGVLTVTLPVAEKVRPRKIQIAAPARQAQVTAS